MSRKVTLAFLHVSTPPFLGVASEHHKKRVTSVLESETFEWRSRRAREDVFFFIEIFQRFYSR